MFILLLKLCFVLLATESVFDGTQEMMTLGLCNMVASFFRSMPVSGSFGRSAVNDASGVQTTFGNLYTGCLVLLALRFLTPYFFYIPKATLSSVLICAVIFMIEFRLIGHIWKANSKLSMLPWELNIYLKFKEVKGVIRLTFYFFSEKDLIPAFVTFITCLVLGIEIGILAGLLIEFIYLLYINARPKYEVNDKKVKSISYTNLLPIILFLIASFLSHCITVWETIKL